MHALFCLFVFVPGSVCAHMAVVDVCICIYAYISTFVHVYTHICICKICVLCFAFCFLMWCLLVDASVVCVLKMLLFLALLLCFLHMCVPIYMWSCVHIWGWDRVVLGVCMFGAGAGIQLKATGG